MYRRIAMISEHASPLGCLGGTDSGGQNVYVDQVARGLGRIGYDVDVFTRRDAADLPTFVKLAPGVKVVHVTAGPARRLPKEELLPYMDEFADRMATICGGRLSYDLAHANFWMSGLVAARLKRRCGLPFVITFHALGKMQRLHQGGADRFPPQRSAIESKVMEEADRIIAECPQDEDDQIRLYGADPRKIQIVPCGFDPAELWPINCLEDRLRVLAALSCVDHLVAFHEDAPHALIRAIRPDVFVKGGDYTRETLPEAALVEQLGGRVQILPYLAGRSTTRLIERIADAGHPAGGRLTPLAQGADEHGRRSVDRRQERPLRPA